MYRSVLAAVLGVGVIVGIATIEGAAALSVTACATTDASTIFSPVSGIIVQADPLVSPYGCGELPGEVYKYAPVVRDSAGRLVAAQIYDCFADGTFVNLTGTGGDASDALVFTVQIYAWNQQSYTANYAAIASNVTTVNAAAAADGGYIADPFLATPATWTTSCEATQTTNIEQVAVCQPLVPEATAQPPTPADGGEDAGADGGKDTGGDGKD